MMQPKQRDYVMERVNAIENDKIRKIQDDYTVQLTKEQKCKLARDGKAKMLSLDRQSSYGDEIKFDFDPFERSWNSVAEAKRLIEEIKAKAVKIKDEIMIGDCEEAFKLLKQFEKEA